MKHIKPGLGLVVVAILGLSLFFVLGVYLAADDESLAAPIAVEEVFLTALPVRLLIPSIEVDAAIQTVGLAENSIGAMGVPDNFTDVGWYKYGPRPGMPGSAVIAGHLNGKDVSEAVFYDLSAVSIGDTVIVTGEDGAVLTFKVVDIRVYPHDAVTEEIFISDDGRVRLNLITCAGEWLSQVELYEERTVIFTELVSEVD